MTERRAKGWPADVTRGVGQSVARYRKARNWSGERLIAELAGLGVTMSRSTLTNLEAQRREAIGVHEVFALAAALDVPPVALLVADPAEPVSPRPDQQIDGMAALAWLTGQALPTSVPAGDWPEADQRYRDAGKALHLLREHAAFAHDVVAVAQLRRSPDAMDLYRRRVDDLRDLRADIAHRGWPLPPLPPELSAEEIDGPPPTDEEMNGS